MSSLVLTTSALPQVEGASRTHHRHRAFFVGSEMVGLATSGQLDYVPISLEEVPRLLTSGRLRVDVALLQVSPPDARGFVSLGVSVDLAPAILSVVRTAIAEVNPAMPRTHGKSLVHLDRFDARVKVDAPVAEYVHPEIGEVAERVARYIASIIDDGSSTIRFSNSCRSIRYVIRGWSPINRAWSRSLRLSRST